MIPKNFRKKFLTRTVLGETSLRTVLRLLGLLVLAFLGFSPVAVGAVSDVQFSIPFSKFNPYLSKLKDIKNEIVSSITSATSQTANILDTFTDNLRDAWRAYVNPLPPLPTTVPTRVGAIITVSAPPPVISDQALLNALSILFNNKEIASRFRGSPGLPGPEGKEGPPGPKGETGSSLGRSPMGEASVTYIPSNPSTNFGGASIFSVTDLSANKLITETAKVTTLNVEGTSTLTGTLNATSIAIGNNTLTTSEWAFLDGINQTLATTSSPTFNVLTVTSCTGCSPSTSLALSTAISDETGSGALVFANTPTFVTPVLGVATATSIAIGANVVDTNEWAFLDGVNQTLATTSSPSFTHINLPLQGELRLKDADSSNYVGFKSPSVVGSNQIWTLPSTDSSGCFQSNGVGLITIAACSGAAAAGAGII